MALTIALFLGCLTCTAALACSSRAWLGSVLVLRHDGP